MQIITLNGEKRFFVLDVIQKSIFDEYTVDSGSIWTETSQKDLEKWTTNKVIIENDGLLYSCYEIIDAEIKPKEPILIASGSESGSNK